MRRGGRELGSHTQPSQPGPRTSQGPARHRLMQGLDGGEVQAAGRLHHQHWPLRHLAQGQGSRESRRHAGRGSGPGWGTGQSHEPSLPHHPAQWSCGHSHRRLSSALGHTTWEAPDAEPGSYAGSCPSA